MTVIQKYDILLYFFLNKKIYNMLKTEKTFYCNNSSCGIEKFKESDYCIDCNKAKKLDEEANEKFKGLTDYKSLCEKKKIKNTMVCGICNNNRYSCSRLCKSCINNTYLCNLCKTRIYEKHNFCQDCNHKTDQCIVLFCDKKKINKSNYCIDDKCQNDLCDDEKHGYKKINHGSYQRNYQYDYCKKCTCNSVTYNGACTKMKLQNNNFCEQHICTYKNCKISSYECYGHYCKSENCDKIKVYGKDYCDFHMCKFYNCKYMIKIETEKYHFSETIKKFGNYCEIHSCEYCLNKKYKDKFKLKTLNGKNDSKIVNEKTEKTKTTSSTCFKHKCCVNYCDTSSGFLCFNHDIISFCENFNHKSYLNTLKSLQRANLKYGIDWELVWMKLYDDPIYKRFIEWFKETSIVLFYVLKQNNISKDIRKLIFYKYLENTFNFYFSEKDCYKCLLICNDDDNCEIGWPFNKKCKKHVCKVDKCCNVKKTPIKTNKCCNVKNTLIKTNPVLILSDFCQDHTCKVNNCNYLVDNNKKYCFNHLCPLCMKYGTFGRKNFCKKCRCKKWTKTEKGPIRCKYPKHYNSKFCKEHNQIVNKDKIN